MKKRKATKTAKAATQRKAPEAVSFPVVGIGASAGGLEAATQLLKNLPANTGMGFVLVQHLDPQHESALAALLSRTTRMPVMEAREGMRVQRNHVYVIPPNKKMGISNRTLRLLPRGDNGGDLHAPVDYFFHSLASDLGGQAIGIVLSGTGSDGTLGLEQIKAEGGITFVQSEKSAKYGGMPGSAGASGCADFILSPAEIAVELARIGQHPRLLSAKVLEIEEKAQPDGDEFKQICSLLRRYSGVDFGHYKPSTLRRRIGRRMVLLRLDTLKDYVSALRKNSTEVEALFEDILIGVTSFFRDPKAFEMLKRKVFPRIIKNKPSDAAVRIWVAGCSTGEEVYSLAIAITEFMEKEGVRCPVQLFGTDINEAILNRARAGVYPESITTDVSADRLRRFFTNTQTGYRINKSIRDMCVFARQNVIQDPPFSHVDLISCRNVLIYFGAALQKK